MQPQKRPAMQTARTTASQLAELGFCEQKVVLQHRLGPRVSQSRRVAQSVGTAEHQQFLDSAFREQPMVMCSPNVENCCSPNRSPPLLLRLLRFLCGLLIGKVRLKPITKP